MSSPAAGAASMSSTTRPTRRQRAIAPDLSAGRRRTPSAPGMRTTVRERLPNVEARGRSAELLLARRRVHDRRLHALARRVQALLGRRGDGSHPPLFLLSLLVDRLHLRLEAPCRF